MLAIRRFLDPCKIALFKGAIWLSLSYLVIPLCSMKGKSLITQQQPLPLHILEGWSPVQVIWNWCRRLYIAGALNSASTWCVWMRHKGQHQYLVRRRFQDIWQKNWCSRSRGIDVFFPVIILPHETLGLHHSQCNISTEICCL